MRYIERKPLNKEDVQILSKTTNLDPLIIKLLMMRNIDTAEAINAYMKSDISLLSPPSKLTNINNAADIINKIIKSEKPIVIYGDYDCDGIGALSILYLTLKHLNAKVFCYIPQRHEEGYGLNIEAIDRINSDYSPKLFITVDCGITSVKEVDYIKSLGIDVVITDHHEAGSVLPDTVIVNPILDGNNNPLCGAGVALKLAEALTDRKFIHKLMDICAISTLADVVPLIGDNRIIVKEGLEMLSKGKCRESLKKLISLSGITKGKNVTAGDIAYRIAPRINASGRLSSAYKSLNLIISDDLTEINMLAEELEKENRQRQDIFAEVLNDALSMLENYDLSRNLIIVLQSEEWEEGVVGIAAAKIVEQFCRPTILFTNKGGVLKGSARSISGINIYEVIKSCKDMLLKYGGHAMAAGLSIKREDFNAFSTKANEFIKQTAEKDCFERKVIYDENVCICDLKKELIDSLIELEPFGCSNPKPVFICKANELNFVPIGRHPHIKCKKKNCYMLAFNKRYALPLLNNDTEKTLTYILDKEIYNNKEYLQCKLKNIYSPKTNIEKQVLFARYLETFTYKGDKGKVSKKVPCNNYSFGTLYITYTNSAFNNFDAENKGYEKFVFNTEIMNPYNAVILSPEKDFIYTYYNKIVFWEKPTDNMLDYIKSSFNGMIEICDNGFPKFDVDFILSVELLRSDYLFFRYKLHNMNLDDMQIFFSKAVKAGYKREFIDLCISYYIFYELELLTVNNSGNIILHNKKVDLEQSNLFKWLNEYKERV